MVSAFAQTLRRYTSLNHLAQAARAVLQNTSQINQMLSDLNRVDFANVQVTFPTAWMGLEDQTARQGQCAREPNPSGLDFHPLEKRINPQSAAIANPAHISAAGTRFRVGPPKDHRSPLQDLSASQSYDHHLGSFSLKLCLPIATFMVLYLGLEKFRLSVNGSCYCIYVKFRPWVNPLNTHTHSQE